MTRLAQNWYAAAAGRKYPIDDGASAETDDGRQLPGDILADCYLRFPRTLGEYACVSSIHASGSVVSVTFMATNGLAVDSGCTPESSEVEGAFAPLASVTIARKDLVIGRQYPIAASVPGVGGWVVFGPALQPFSGLFSTAEQAALAPRVCRAYDLLPVPSVAKLYHESALTGLVKIVGGTDVSVTKDQRLIAGELRDALVIALADSAGRNVLDIYRGPCSGRPESDTCNQPAVETIGGISPDCQGNLTIEVISDCAAVVPANGGIVIDFCLGLADACTKSNRLPVDGRLPNDFDDYCNQDQWTTVEAAPGVTYQFETLAVEQWESHSSTSSSMYPCVELPYVENFDDGEADYFLVKDGTFAVDNGVYKATAEGARNLAIWDGCTHPTMRHFPLATEFLLPPGEGQVNAGLVFDWKEGTEPTYYVVEADKRTDSFRLRFYTGVNFVNMLSRPRVSLKYDTPYAIVVSFTEYDDYYTAHCELRENGIHGTILAAFDANLNRLKTPYGRAGLQAYLSPATFFRFIVGDAEDEVVVSSSQTPVPEASSVGGSTPPCDLPVENLVAYWNLLESGAQSRRDTIGTLDLTATGDPLNAVGAFGGLGVNITGIDQYLQSDETTSLNFGAGTSFTCSGFAWFDAQPTAATILWGKYGIGGLVEWLVYADADGFHAVFSPNGTTQDRVVIPYADIPTDTEFHIVLWRDVDAKTINLTVNEQTVSREYASDIYQGTNPFNVALQPIHWTDGEFVGRIDELTIFNCLLTQDQRDCLRTEGIDPDSLNRLYSSSEPATVIRDPLTFWRLDEASRDATRVDLLNSNYLFPAPVDAEGQLAGTGFVEGVLDGAASIDSDGNNSGRPLIRTRAHGLFGLAPGFALMSLGGWVKGGFPNQKVPIAGVYGFPDQQEYAVLMTPTGFEAVVFDADGGETRSYFDTDHGYELPGDDWRHVMLIFRGNGRVRVYVNGEAGTLADEITSVRSTESPFVLGGWSYDYGEKYVGWVGLDFDDWGFWNDSLTVDEVLAIYNNGEGWQPDEPGP
jgi:hypothetical protein